MIVLVCAPAAAQTMPVITACVVRVLAPRHCCSTQAFHKWKPTFLAGRCSVGFLGNRRHRATSAARRLVEFVFSEPLETCRGRLASHQCRMVALGSRRSQWANIYIAWTPESGMGPCQCFRHTVAMWIFMIPQVIWLSRQDRHRAGEWRT